MRFGADAVRTWSLVFVPLALAYAMPLRWCWQLWEMPESYFAHGILVLPVMAFVIWRQRARWSRVPAQADLRGWLLLGPALLVHLVGAALNIDSVSAASLVLAAPGAAWLALGRSRLAGMWPALWLPAFAVPLPIYVTDRIAFELKEVAVQGGVFLAQVFGLAVERQGASIFVPGQSLPLDVADPCGGLRSLLAMVMLTYCIAFFMGPKGWPRRLLLLAAAAPVAVFVNLVRIACICWAAHWYGVEFGAGLGHDLLNGFAWLLDLGIVMALDAALVRRRSAAQKAAPVAAVQVERRAVPMASGALLWLLALPVFLLSVSQPLPSVRGRAAALPSAVEAFAVSEAFPMTSRMHQLLGTDDACWRSYDDGSKRPLYMVGVFHGANWKSIHPPHICLLGSDMEILREDAIRLGEGDQEVVGRIVLETRRDRRPYVSLFVYGSADLCTDSYLEFFLHHAPKALFRSSNDGFLIRVEAYADLPGGVDAASRRCLSLMRPLVAAARGLLR